MSENQRNIAGNLATQLAAEIYKDLAHPTAANVGRALETISKVALSPVALLDWSFEQTKDWLKEKVVARLSTIPAEYLASPSLRVVVPAITHVAMAHDSPSLRDLYAELLLKAMDGRTKDSVHPAYVHLVAQLSPEEALVLMSLHALGRKDLFKEETNSYWYDQNPTIESQFEGHCKSLTLANADSAPLWLDNFLRLRLLSLTSFTEAEYVPEEYNRDGNTGPEVRTTETRYLFLTTLGQGLIDACTPSSARA